MLPQSSARLRRRAAQASTASLSTSVARLHLPCASSKACGSALFDHSQKTVARKDPRDATRVSPRYPTSVGSQWTRPQRRPRGSWDSGTNPSPPTRPCHRRPWRTFEAKRRPWGVPSRWTSGYPRKKASCSWPSVPSCGPATPRRSSECSVGGTIGRPGRPRSGRTGTQGPLTWQPPPCAPRGRHRCRLSPVTAKKVWTTITKRNYGDAVTFFCCGSSACPPGILCGGHLEQNPRGSPRWS